MTSPLDNLQEQFRHAAARQIERERGQRVRRRRLIAGLTVAATATGGLAVATDLISTGAPARKPPLRTRRYRPGQPGSIAVTAPDKDSPLPWGVMTYRSRQGEFCAQAGAVRGNEIGTVTGGTFHPYPRSAVGDCGNVARVPYFVTSHYLGGRTLYFGRARRDVTAMRLTVDGTPHRANTGAGGAYLFVFSGRVAPGAVTATALGADGRPVK